MQRAYSILFKSFLIIIVSLLSGNFLFAQAPQLLNYQGVARNSVGNAIPNKNMTLRVTIRNGSATGASVYSETRQIRTNGAGLFATQIGSAGASTVSGSMAGISWSNGSKFLQVELDPEGGNAFLDMGTNQLVSVPYALNADNATNVTGTITIANGGTGATTAATARANLGLGNVDNTSDLNKPVSSATQSALNTKEDLSNKSTNIALGNSDVLYPTQKAVKAYVDQQILSATPDATTTSKGKIQLAGDMTGTSDVPRIAANAVTTSKIADGNVTDAKILSVSGSKVSGNITGNAANVTGTVAIENGGTGSTTIAGAKEVLNLDKVDNTSDLNKPVSTATQTALNTKEDASNKSSNTALGTSDVLFPTQNAVKTYVDQQVQTATPDATSSSKGKIQLAGDLTNTADIPRIANNAVTTAKIADGNVTTVKLADASVTDAKIVSVSASKITGNISGNAANVSGTVAIANGGTGATTVIGAKTALGLENVSNTSDLSKPVSTATQTALNLKEDVSNKSSNTSLGTSDDYYPTQKAVKTYVDLQVQTATPDATASSKGKIQLAGDLTNTAEVPRIANNAITTAKIVDAAVTDAKIASVSASKITGNISGNAANVSGTVAIANGGTGATTVVGAKTALGLENVSNTSDLNKPVSTATQTALNLKEDVSNKSSNTSLGTSDDYYPTQKAVKTYVDQQVQTATPDATASSKGKIQLAGDLTNTAADPRIANNAITTAKLADGSVTDAKVISLSASKITGNISGNAANVTGTIAIANGGTGATTVVGAKTALALENVDNTTDLNKPVSAATQTALNLKEDVSNKSSNTSLGTSDDYYPTQKAVKTYVDAQVANTNLTVGSISGSSTANGASIASGVLKLAPADASNGGIVTAGTQTIAGNKTFSGGTTFNENIRIRNVDAGTFGDANQGNTMFGWAAFAYANPSTASNNTGFGLFALGNTSGIHNTAVGANAMRQGGGTGSHNVAIGSRALSNGSISNENVAVGFSALDGNTGSQNVSIGTRTYINNTGDNNVGVGYQAGYWNTSGNNNTFIGHNADAYGNANNLTNAIAIGSNAKVTASNTIQLGNTNITDVNTSGKLKLGVVTYPNTDGTSGQVLTTNGSGSLSWANSSSITMGAISNTATANGATISSGVLNLAPADATNGGIVTTGTQTLAGDKNFKGSVNSEGSLTANAAVSSEITADLTINASNAETYKSKILICNPNAPITITFAAGLPVGFNCMVLQKSADANVINFAAGSGATLKNRNLYTATAGNYALATIVHIGGDIIVTAGDMH